MAKFHSLSSYVLPGLALVCGVLTVALAACGDTAVDRKAEIDKAVHYSGGPVFPTVDPTIKAREAFGFSIGIIGLRDFYPKQADEKISVNITNNRDSSIFFSQFCNTLLQHQLGTPEETKWEDIAYGRPCPPNDTPIYQVYPRTVVNADFIFKNTRPLPGKSWNVAGTYRLLLIYFMRCPDAYSTVSYCEDKHTFDSETFQIKTE